MDQPAASENQHEQQPDRVCLCAHSAAAHQFLSSGRCSFCSCQQFAARAEEIPTTETTLSAGPALDAGYILLRDMAEQLGVAARILRRAASKSVVPAMKVDRRWAIQAKDVKHVAE